LEDFTPSHPPQKNEISLFSCHQRKNLLERGKEIFTSFNINSPPIPFWKERKKGRKSHPTSPNKQLLWEKKKAPNHTLRNNKTLPLQCHPKKTPPNFSFAFWINFNPFTKKKKLITQPSASLPLISTYNLMSPTSFHTTQL